jgi:hypothetical protein
MIFGDEPGFGVQVRELFNYYSQSQVRSTRVCPCPEFESACDTESKVFILLDIFNVSSNRLLKCN